MAYSKWLNAHNKLKKEIFMVIKKFNKKKFIDEIFKIIIIAISILSISTTGLIAAMAMFASKGSVMYIFFGIGMGFTSFLAFLQYLDIVKNIETHDDSHKGNT